MTVSESLALFVRAPLACASFVRQRRNPCSMFRISAFHSTNLSTCTCTLHHSTHFYLCNKILHNIIQQLSPFNFSFLPTTLFRVADGCSLPIPVLSEHTPGSGVARSLCAASSMFITTTNTTLVLPTTVGASSVSIIAGGKAEEEA